MIQSRKPRGLKVQELYNMKYQKFIDNNIINIVKYNRHFGYPRTLFGAYGSPSPNKIRVFDFLDRRAKYYIFDALNKKIRCYGFLAYIEYDGISTYSKSCFNYCLEFKIFDKYSDKYFNLSIVFTKDYMYISDNIKYNYRFAWNYDTDFSKIISDLIKIYNPNGADYMY